jgi:hypothetical protein
MAAVGIGGVWKEAKEWQIAFEVQQKLSVLLQGHVI